MYPTSQRIATDAATQLATVWKAVLLIDEADIFLQKRATSDIERNALVGVFLRRE